MSDTPSSMKRSKAPLSEALCMIEDAGLVALDLETTGLDPRRNEVRLIQVSDGTSTFIVDCQRVDATPLVQALRSKTILAHGADFEYQFLYHRYGVELEDVRDTLLMTRVLACGDMSVSASLGALAERMLDTALDKEMQGADWSGELTSRHYDYAAKDVQVLFPLFAGLAGELARAGLEGVAALENVALPAVARMKLAGVPIDKVGWDAASAAATEELEALKREMLELDGLPERDPVPQTWALQGKECLEMLRAAGVEAAGTTTKELKPYEEHELVRQLLAYRKAKGAERETLKAAVLDLAPEKPPKPAPPWNFGSQQQIQEICYKLLGYYPRSVDEATLLRSVEHHPFFRYMLRYRKLSKRVSTYGTGWFKEAYDPNNGRVYANWHQVGTSTGRFACSAPNLQNIPAEYRRFVIAPPGRSLVSVDYSQIEVRVYAKIVEETALLDLFDQGADIYKSTAANLLDIREEEVTKTQRQKAKAIVLGLLYGLSARGLPGYAFSNYGVEILPDEAEELIEKFFELYPAIAADHDKVLTELNETGSVDRVTIAGRRRDGIVVRNEAINAPIQGSAADGLKKSMAAVHRRLKRFKGTAFTIISLHDELVIECDEEDADEVLRLVKEAMTEAMDELLNAEGRRVPVKVTGTVTNVWSKD
jgi:DNA polymerase-1